MKQLSLFPTEEEMEKIKDIVEALTIVDVTSKLLCERDCSLSDADRVRLVS